MRVTLRYAALVLLGFGAGWWLARPSSPLERKTQESVKADAVTLGAEPSALGPAPTFTHVLKLGQSGGGLRQDAKLHEALMTIRAQDFRDSLALWTEETMQKLLSDDVRAGAILDRWFELDSASAKAYAEKFCTPVRGERMSASLRFRNIIAASAARSDPNWALEHLLHEVEYIHFSNPNESVICEVAKRDPAVAKEWMARMENSKLRESLMAGYVEGIAKSDPLAALDIAVAEKGFERLNLIPNAVEAAASKGRGAALEALAKIDDPELRRRAALGAMGVLARETNTNVAQFLDDAIGRDHLADFKGRSFAFSDFIEADPAAAAQWAAGLPAQDRAEFLNQVFERWNDIDPDTAKKWIGENPTSSGNNAQGPPLSELNRLWAASRLIESRSIGETLSALSNLSDEALMIGNITQKLASKDPAATAQWLLSLPDGKVRETGMQSVAWQWALKDPDAAVDWLEQLPAGSGRNNAILSTLGHIADDDPERAARLATLNTDPQSRAIGIRIVYSNWAARDPAAAREWVRTLPGVDGRWKAKFLRQNP